MKILTIVSSPGPAESIGLLVKKMRESSQEAELINVSNDITDSRVKGVTSGSGKIFERMHLDYKEASFFGHIENYFNIPITFADKIIDKVRPQKVLTGTYRDPSGLKMTLEDAIILSARRRKILAYQYVDLWDNWFPKKERKIIPDVFLVHDTIGKELIKKRGGIKDGQIVTVGSPALEDFIQKRLDSKIFKKSDFGLDNKRVIAYFGQCSPIRNDISLPWVINILRGNDLLIFSQHPRDNRNYDNYLKNPQVKQLNIHSDGLLDFADICITHTSMMGIKADFLGIKTINIILENEFAELLSLCGRYPLDLMGGSQQVKDELELKKAIENDFTVSDNFKRMLQELRSHNALGEIIKILE